MLISDESPLRRLLVGIGRKQLLFLDGVRHAAEIVDLAYARLRDILSPITLEDQNAPFPRGRATASFLDSWVIVDAVDRLRGLLHLMPDQVLADSTDIRRFLEESKVVRSLRNVTDHLAERADYVIANDSTALGILNWVTYRPGDNHATSFVFTPGTIVNREAKLVDPTGKMLSQGVNLVTLSAGEYSVNISELMPKVADVVRHVEAHLAALNLADPNATRSGSDMLVSVEFHSARR